MRTLHVLGGLWLDDGDGPSSGRGAQRRRLALLTLLSLSPSRRLTRDKAIATLWPENTSAEGRRRLSSAVYDLRRLLGDDAIESAGDELWISPNAPFRVDVDDFESAVARGDVEAALASYRGALLDGVHLSGAAEFEEWIAARRDRIHRQLLQALEQAAAERSACGDHRRAVSAALQLVDLDPLSGRAALVAVDALAAAGDRPRALAVADAYAARVRRELAVDPDDAVVAAARQLRAGPTPSSERPLPPSTPPASSDARVDGPEHLGVQPSVASTATRPIRRFEKLLLRGAVAAGIAVAALAGAAYRSRASAPKQQAAGNVGLTGLVAAAAASTASPAALQSFVDGERAYSQGRYDAAAKSFSAAVAQDSTFALAHWRLSAAMLWQDEPGDLIAVHDSLALVWSAKLPEEERLLLRGYVAWRRGDYDAAETLDHAATVREPANAETEFQLGEVLFHYNSLRGRPIAESDPWFLRVLQRDSANWGARWHVLLLDAPRVTPAEFHARVAELLATGPDGHSAAELRLFAADGDELSHLAATASASMLYDAAWRRAIFRRDLVGAESLLARIPRLNPANEWDQATAGNAIAALRFGRGFVQAGMQALEIPGAKRVFGGDTWIIRVHGLIANRVDTSKSLDTLARAIARWREKPTGFDEPSGAPRIVARYLDGLIAAARGDTVAASRAAADLDEIARRGALPDGYRNPRELALTILAYEHWRSGRCDDALRELDQERSQYWLGLVASSAIDSQSLERYVRAQCLLSVGRYVDAIRWFESLEQGTLYDLEFLGAALRGQAAARLAMGDTLAARALERRMANIAR